MSNIIYSKYSNERSDKFKIRTSIFEDVFGNRKVEKIALSEKSEEHIKNIYKNYKILSKLYKDTKISVNRCSLNKNTVSFDYLSGETLEEYLNNLFEKKDYESMLETIKKYVRIIRESPLTDKFRVTEEFETIFGKVELSNDLIASQVSNVDMLFSNIILLNEWNIIDYEWTFEFLIPINYIIYRALLYYFRSEDMKNEFGYTNLFKLLDISEAEIKQYRIMENNFQNYVLDQSIPSWKIYQNLNNKNFIVQDIIKSESNSMNNCIQVFFDYGNGFNELNSYVIKKYSEYNINMILKIDIEKDTKCIRIDPSNDNCIIKINRILINNKEIKKVDYETNGNTISEDTIFFDTKDPQLYLNGIYYETITLDIEIQILNDKIVSEISKIVYDMKCKDFIIREKENVILEKDTIIGEKENVILEKDTIIGEKENVILEKDIIIGEKENVILEKDTIIGEKENVILEQNAIIEKKQNILFEKNNKITELENIIQEIYNSRSWKLIQKIKKFVLVR